MAGGGSSKRSAKRAAKEERSYGIPRGGPGRHAAQRHAVSGQQAVFKTHASLGARAHPFGPEGPSLQIERRQRSAVLLSIHGFLVLVMLVTLLVLGLDPGVSLLCHWTWALLTFFGVVALVGNTLCPRFEPWLIFWFLPMLHGLLWLQLALIGTTGVWPSSLWATVANHGGGRLLMAQLGTAPLLVLPLLALLAYMWIERSYLLVIYYDCRSQLLPEHRTLNIFWHINSPAIPLAVWAYCFNPRLYTDLPRWPGTLPVVLVAVLANSAMLYYCHRRTSHFTGMVRWMRGALGCAWLVWCKPDVIT